MAIKTEQIADVTIIAPEGRFDAFQAPAFNDWLAENSESRQPYLVVDLAEVTFIDTAALASLVKWMKAMRQRGGDLKISRLTQPVRIIFELTRMDHAFDLFDAVDVAAAAFDRG